MNCCRFPLRVQAVNLADGLISQLATTSCWDFCHGKSSRYGAHRLVLHLLGAGLGMLMGRFPPPHHLSNEAKSVIAVATVVVGTASALVLGLLISAASTTFSQ